MMQAARARRCGPGAPGADDDYSRALDRWLALGGADLDGRADAVAAGPRPDRGISTMR